MTEKAIRIMERMPPIPVVVNELIELRSQPQVGLSRLEEVLAKDPLFCGKVIRMANSPFYGARSEITSIGRAVAMLGWDAVSGVAMAAAARGSFSDGPTEVYGETGLWEHSLRTAHFSQWLAEHAFEGSTSEGGSLFLGALLHDIGRVALDPLMRETLGSDQPPSWDARDEKRHHAVDHSEIGVEVCRRWQLPTIVLSVIDGHHCPQKGNVSSKVSSILHVADVLSARSDPELVEGLDVSALPLQGSALEILEQSADSLQVLLETKARPFARFLERLSGARDA